MGLTTPKLSSIILKSFKKILADRDSMPFNEFLSWALYDPDHGYYQKKKIRVGKGMENDFYTSTSLGSLWGELILNASLHLLGNRNPDEYTFVEIGAEPNSSIFDGIQQPFFEHRIIHLGDPIKIPSKSVVYSNEWLDAQPFQRFQFVEDQSKWTEVFVGEQDGQLIEIKKEKLNSHPCPLPTSAPNGYLIDWPSGSIESMNRLLSQDQWMGVFITFDYGLDRRTILHDRPEGTARAYRKQKMTTNLLEDPTEKDITCHLCWDDLQETLHRYGFENISLQTQESFLMKNSQQAIQNVFQTSSSFDPQMLALRELIHPAHLGHGLQALSAVKF